MVLFRYDYGSLRFNFFCYAFISHGVQVVYCEAQSFFIVGSIVKQTILLAQSCLCVDLSER